MSSYFDNQDGGDDYEEKHLDNSDSDESSINDIEDGEEKDDIEEELVNEIDDDIDEDIDEDIDDDDIEYDDDDEIQNGGNEPELEDGEIDENAEKKVKRTKKVPAKAIYKKQLSDDEDEDDDDDDGEVYLQKFDQSIHNNYIVNFHPECVLQNYDEILIMTKVIRDQTGIIIDDLHKTIPYLTKYEKARILGQRAKQINSGATPFVKVPEDVIDGYLIAELELKEKRIPFIIRRPLPNGGSEYWSIRDLEDISF